MASRVQLASSGEVVAASSGSSGAAAAAASPRWARMVPSPQPEEAEEEAPRGVFAAAAATARCFPVENSRSLGREDPFLAEDAAAAELAAAAPWKPSTCSR